MSAAAAFLLLSHKALVVEVASSSLVEVATVTAAVAAEAATVTAVAAEATEMVVVVDIDPPSLRIFQIR